ncbi:I78 family peptidase inhibitor [Pseudomonas sp. DWP3-1-2]|uniref:I78 family peptidase inhibitor n=1 Tax=Pseudomonas sp. DWP3-1-2 TaxID=2804645 RepID=UPI003CEB62D2
MPWKSVSLGLVVAASLLAGCSSNPESSSTEPSASAPVAEAGHTRCDAAAAQFAVGQPASAALLAQAKSKAGAQEARFIGPNDMVTLEYRSDRVNLNTDAGGKVTRVNCG